MKKENILSVLIDESGDFGKLDYNDPYYYVLMVLHEQNNSINDMVDALETKLKNWGYENHYIHVGPLIRREKPYHNDLREDRKSLFNAFHTCSESVLEAFSDVIGISEAEAKSISMPFAGGRMGKCG